LFGWIKNRFKKPVSEKTKDKAAKTAKSTIAPTLQALTKAPRPVDRPTRVLIATHFGAFNHGTVTDSVLGLGLQERGAAVDLLLCDKFLPACQIVKFGAMETEAFLAAEHHDRCDGCYKTGKTIFGATELPVLTLSSLVSTEQKEKIETLSEAVPLANIRTFEVDGLPIGEHAYAGALRYFARGDLENEPHSAGILRKYLKAALYSLASMETLFARERYDVVVAHHGIYVPQGIVVAAANRAGARIVTWNPAYRKHCFIFSHDDTYHRTMTEENPAVWENLAWNADLDKQLDGYLKSRWYGTEDWIWFHQEPQHDLAAIQREVGFDPQKPVISLLSNVVWDAQLHYPSNAFNGMMEWVCETIRYFEKRPELQLVIRTHPAEIRGFVPSRQLLEDEIKKAFPTLPKNVFFIPPTSSVSTYALCEGSNAVLIYNTKTGLEVTAKGIPTIVAGEAWVRNKGFTWDAATPAEYFGHLDQLPFASKMSDEQLLRARKYAFHIFFRRMIPFPFLTSGKTNGIEIQDGDPALLTPGKFPGLDLVCDGILKATPFVYPAEILELSDRRQHAPSSLTGAVHAPA